MNTRNWRIAAIAAAVVCVAGATRETEAACNLIPSGKMFRSGSPGFANVVVPSDLPFRGDAGRINRALIVPGVTPSLVLGSDPTCQTTQTPPPNPVGFVIRQAYGDVPPRLTAHLVERPSTVVTDILRTLPARLGNAKFEISSKSMRVLDGPGDSPRYLIPLDSEWHGGRVSVAVLDATSLSGTQPITWHITGPDTSPCHVLTGRVAPSAVGSPEAVRACVDRIYEDFIPKARCGTDDAHIDSVVGALFESPPPNDFRDQCDSIGGDIDPDYPKCRGTPTALATGVQSTGALTLPFKYVTIREWSKNGKEHTIDRELRGVSALTRTKILSSGRIVLPGDEFIGSSPDDSQLGNPWRPDIDVIQPSDNTAELQIDGAVDKDSSVLTFFPRMLVSIVCDSGAACQTFDETPDTETPICSCGRGPTPETCTCAREPLPSPRYFACNEASGNRKGMPCTRSSHCGDTTGRACSATPLCYTAGTTWGSVPNLNGGECVLGFGCSGAYRQCGFLLFNFADRVTRDETRYLVDYTIDKDSEQAGMCKGDRNGKNREWCSSDDMCERELAPCLGFSLEARGKRPNPD